MNEKDKDNTTCHIWMPVWMIAWMIVRRIRAEEAGATLVYVTLVLPVLLSIAGLTLDGSNLYWQQRRMQIAADAAALAGAGELALGSTASTVAQVVQTLATANGADTTTWTISADGLAIQVETTHTFDPFFAGIMGFTTLAVQAESTAQVAAITRMGNLLPMATMCDTSGDELSLGFILGLIYTLWDSLLNVPGNVGWLDWDGGSNGASELADNIANPSNSGVWEVGDWVPGSPGVKNSAQVRQAMDSWIGETVTIILYDQVSGQGSNTEYRICGFASFELTDYNFQGALKWVQGRFVRTVQRGGVSSGDAPDTGLRTVRLVP